MGRLVIGAGGADLAKVVHAACRAGPFPCRLHGRQQQGHEEAEHADCDQQFGQCEAGAAHDWFSWYSGGARVHPVHIASPAGRVR